MTSRSSRGFRHTPFVLTLLGFAMLSACTTVPTPNAQLNQANVDFRAAQRDPRANALAAPEMKQAQQALNAAQAAWFELAAAEGVNHLAYVATQRVTIARETVALRAAEQSASSASAVRDDIRLQARTQEADTAVRQASEAQRQTDLARADTAQARQDTEVAETQNRALLERLRELNAKPSPRGLVVTLGDVLFDTDKAQLKPTGLRMVQQLAAVLNEYTQRTVLIEGFTDSTGSDAHNLALSVQRAEAVRTALLSEGIVLARVFIRGYGESSPVASNDSADGRVLNRRVEILLSDARGYIVAR